MCTVPRNACSSRQTFFVKDSCYLVEPKALFTFWLRYPLIMGVIRIQYDGLVLCGGGLMGNFALDGRW